ncbi:retrotransposon protein, putative, ty1-copia subclass [Tanacetum coccineum]
MDNSKRGHILMQERLDLNKTQGASTPKEVKRMQNVPYASAVGSIINTKDMFLVYGGNPEAELRVDCYCNAGFETDIDDMKSLTGYVDQVIKEENVLDVYVMLYDYCHLVLQMFNLIEQEKDCPHELKEAASSLLYAAPRCGEFPELQEIRVVLTARYGKEFANGAIDLRNNLWKSLVTKGKEGTSIGMPKMLHKMCLNQLHMQQHAQPELQRRAVPRSRQWSDNPNSPNTPPRKVLEKPKLEIPEPELGPEHEMVNVEAADETSKNNTKDTSGIHLIVDKPMENNVVFDESDNEIENEPVGFMSSKQLEFDSGNIEPRFDKGSKVHQQI